MSASSSPGTRASASPASICLTGGSRASARVDAHAARCARSMTADGGPFVYDASASKLTCWNVNVNGLACAPLLFALLVISVKPSCGGDDSCTVSPKCHEARRRSWRARVQHMTQQEKWGRSRRQASQPLLVRSWSSALSACQAVTRPAGVNARIGFVTTSAIESMVESNWVRSRCSRAPSLASTPVTTYSLTGHEQYLDRTAVLQLGVREPRRPDLLDGGWQRSYADGNVGWLARGARGHDPRLCARRVRSRIAAATRTCRHRRP